MSALEKAKDSTGDHSFCEVKYEEWCEDPVRVFESVLAFCELDWTGKFKRSINRFELRNTNYKWQQDLTPDQQDVLESVLRDELQKHGYT